MGGEQRKGILMHIDDAASIDDHINRAVAQDCLTARPTPLPTEVDESIEFISTTPSNKPHSFWDSQLKRAANYVDLTSGIQRTWGNAAPPEVKSATWKMKPIAISELLDNYDLGGLDLGWLNSPTVSPWWEISPRKAYSHGALP